MRTNKNAFSLVELLIVISIIGILAAVMGVNFSKAQKSGRDQRRIEDMKAVQAAAEQYYLLKNGVYPPNANSWSVNNQVVLQKFPTDPINKGDYTYKYNTFNINGGSNYCICAKMENAKNSNSEEYCTFVNTGFYCVKNQQ